MHTIFLAAISKNELRSFSGLKEIKLIFTIQKMDLHITLRNLTLQIFNQSIYLIFCSVCYVIESLHI